MEQLLLILFVLFSVITALLERRKRKKALEEASGANPSAAPSREAEVEEEEIGGWPFPMGGADPFEPHRQPRTSQREDAGPSEPGRLALEVEVEEDREDLEDAAREAARIAQQLQARQRVEELERKRIAAEATEQPARARKSPRHRWKLSASSARRAFVYAEILGLPKALKNDKREPPS